jgi:peptidoglycan hydrolase-like protein with peptidoglycan-binding domain
MRKLLIGTASVLALGVAGAALDFSADAGNTFSDAGMPSASQSLQTPPPATADLTKDDIRQAQLELRNMGLYQGSLDGIVGPETKRALGQFQKNSGLHETATLDQQTLDALVGNPAIGQGSSMPPNAGAAKSMKNSAGVSNMADQAAPK